MKIRDFLSYFARNPGASRVLQLLKKKRGTRIYIRKTKNPPDREAIVIDLCIPA